MPTITPLVKRFVSMITANHPRPLSRAAASLVVIVCLNSVVLLFRKLTLWSEKFLEKILHVLTRILTYRVEAMMFCLVPNQIKQPAQSSRAKRHLPVSSKRRVLVD
jgi:hypothetical protein